MRVFVFLALLAIFATPVFAHTGIVTGSPGDYQLIEQEVDANVVAIHEETGDVFKGWYLAGITNKAAGTSWAGMTIQAQGTGVYLVQGTGLIDEWFITGDSVICSQAGAVPTYSTAAGTYLSGPATLHSQVYFQFATPVEYNQKVSFKIYTDNTAYQNGSFGILFTPTVVPEPSALVAMFSGLVGLAGFAARRRR